MDNDFLDSDFLDNDFLDNAFLDSDFLDSDFLGTKGAVFAKIPKNLVSRHHTMHVMP
ncbi:MAG: hypothetical protein ROM54_07850 [Anaerobiospirillum sp.]|nr:hypothetical protein [Anaerobiospirillum sp.]